ncbi:MAG: hypothetical protein KDD44_02085 [Bdellovibrionales bacterium]|nr:hypothetical protein [Bdellovibrionales bacterium]
MTRTAAPGQDARQFAERLRSAIQQLRAAPRVHEWKSGMEYEVHLVQAVRDGDSYRSDHGFCVAPVAAEMIALDPTIGKPDLGAWQLELATAPATVTGAYFSDLERQLTGWLQRLTEVGQQVGAMPLFAPIPPTLRESDLRSGFLYPGTRYRKLDEFWTRAREEYVRRHGRPPALRGYVPTSINVSSAMASCQTHIELPTDVAEAARMWNAILAATAPVLTACTGAPWLLNRNGLGEQWEQRIGIWEVLDDLERGRVFFGPGWHTDVFQVFDIYAELPRHKLELTDSSDDLQNLKDHVGSIWPHVRLMPEVDCLHAEGRAFGTGAPVDVVAASAFYVGLVYGILETYPDLEERFDFRSACENFHGAARNGLRTHLSWVGGRFQNSGELIVDELLELSANGLRARGVDEADISRYLRIIERRVVLKRTLAHWLYRARDLASGSFSTVTQRLLINQASGLPVHEWPEWKER